MELYTPTLHETVALKPLPGDRSTGAADLRPGRQCLKLELNTLLDAYTRYESSSMTTGGEVCYMREVILFMSSFCKICMASIGLPYLATNAKCHRNMGQ